MTRLELMAEQEIPFPGKRSLAGRIAATDADGVASRAARARLGVEGAVRRAYADLLLARVNRRVVEEQIGAWKEIEEVTRNRYAAGMGTQQDVLRAQAEGTRLLQQRVRDEAAEETARTELARVLPAARRISRDRGHALRATALGRRAALPRGGSATGGRSQPGAERSPPGEGAGSARCRSGPPEPAPRLRRVGGLHEPGRAASHVVRRPRRLGTHLGWAEAGAPHRGGREPYSRGRCRRNLATQPAEGENGGAAHQTEAAGPRGCARHRRTSRAGPALGGFGARHLPDGRCPVRDRARGAEHPLRRSPGGRVAARRVHEGRGRSPRVLSRRRRSGRDGLGIGAGSSPSTKSM
jgi:hypothetical protein